MCKYFSNEVSHLFWQITKCFFWHRSTVSRRLASRRIGRDMRRCYKIVCVYVTNVTYAGVSKYEMFLFCIQLDLFLEANDSLRKRKKQKFKSEGKCFDKLFTFTIPCNILSYNLTLWFGTCFTFNAWLRPQINFVWTTIFFKSKMCPWKFLRLCWLSVSHNRTAYGQ